MGFVDKFGNSLINDEQKIRIPLSNAARVVMAEDMMVFRISGEATFINTVFSNYKEEAKSSVSLYLNKRELELDALFTETEMDSKSKKIAIDKVLSSEKQQIIKKISEYKSAKGGKSYRINNENVEYLKHCAENQYYKSPGLYIRSMLEEYCSLPFIKRERIIKKKIYDIIERACLEKKILNVSALYFGMMQDFIVYPYKIVPDSFHTQSYLVCYSRKAEESEKDKIVASFSMARIQEPTLLGKFRLKKEEISYIESQITKYSPAYLTGKPEQIEVRLTHKGKSSYQSRLYSRPEKIENLSTEDIYVFDCTQQQIFDYFFPFGAEAEILSPVSLRERFRSKHETALSLYVNTE